MKHIDLMFKFSSFFLPRFLSSIINVCVVIFISIGIYLIVFAQKCSLIECIFVRKASCLLNLILLCVEYIRRTCRVSIFFASKNQDLILRNCTRSEPIFNVWFETAAPNFNQLPKSLLLWSLCIKSLNVSNRWLITSKYINVSLLDGHCSR